MNIEERREIHFVWRDAAYKNLPSGTTFYSLTPNEEDLKKKFIDKHKKCSKTKRKLIVAIPVSNFKYSFVNTSAITLCYVKCEICGEEADITDYDNF